MDASAHLYLLCVSRLGEVIKPHTSSLGGRYGDTRPEYSGVSLCVQTGLGVGHAEACSYPETCSLSMLGDERWGYFLFLSSR